MAQQYINTGSSPNAGDGDSARSGGIKINSNFGELYISSSLLQNQIITASNSTASYAISASVAITASYAINSFGSISASFAVSSSNAASASYALTASYLQGNAISSSYALTASFTVIASSSLFSNTSSLSTTSSFAIIASSSLISISSSFSTTSSFSKRGSGSFTGSFIGLFSGSHTGILAGINKSFLIDSGVFVDNDNLGIRYSASGYVNDLRSLTDKEYTDTNLMGLSIAQIGLSDGNFLIWDQGNNNWIPSNFSNGDGISIVTGPIPKANIGGNITTDRTLGVATNISFKIGYNNQSPGTNPLLTAHGSTLNILGDAYLQMGNPGNATFTYYDDPGASLVSGTFIFDTPVTGGVIYKSDYSNVFLPNSLISKMYADSRFIGKILPSSPSSSQNGQSIKWDNSNNIWVYYTPGISSSYATSSANSITSSLALTASYLQGNVTSASYALTASYLQGSITSASYASSSANSISASYSLTSISSSYATSSFSAITASYSLTSVSSSYATSSANALIASFALRGSGSFTGSLFGTSSWSIDSSQSISSSFATTASYALVVGLFDKIITSSYTVVQGDNNYYIYVSSSNSSSITLAPGLDKNWQATFVKSGSGDIIFTSSLGIDATDTRIYTQNGAASVIYKGGNKFAIFGALGSGSASSVTASYALTASYLQGNVTSASYALTASYLQGNVVSSSYASSSANSITSSLALTAVSSSIAISSSFSTTASYALSSSPIINKILSASYTVSQSDNNNMIYMLSGTTTIITLPTGTLSTNWTTNFIKSGSGDLIFTSSTDIDATSTTLSTQNAATSVIYKGGNKFLLLGALGSGSISIPTASYALTASYLQGNVTSASYALTASYLLLAPSISIITSSTNILYTGIEVTILGNTSASGFTTGLYSALSRPGVKVVLKKIASANQWVIDASGSETIDGGLTASLNNNYESITIQSDGNNWQII